MHHAKCPFFHKKKAGIVDDSDFRNSPAVALLSMDLVF